MSSIRSALAFSTDMRQEKWPLAQRLAGIVLDGLRCLPENSPGERIELVQTIALLQEALKEMEAKP